MKFTVTGHARKRCARRGIDLQWISEAIQNPRETFPDLVDPDATSSALRRSAARISNTQGCGE
ncbi:DUF4258 domain-containing protein [Thioalkalicoccus limnaeus]|uniref:DUF4258 domain-containing protein n=1 Tax=Thioalkalicoccus limnaeus TaxID=120681 RepID=UPI0034E9603D